MRAPNLFVTLTLLILTVGCAQPAASADPEGADIQSYRECISAGFVVRKTMPPSCAVPDGRVFFDLPEGLGTPGGRHTCVDQCGDGVCQEIVCMALGCPCPENSLSCPRDCK